MYLFTERNAKMCGPSSVRIVDRVLSRCSLFLEYHEHFLIHLKSERHDAQRQFIGTETYIFDNYSLVRGVA